MISAGVDIGSRTVKLAVITNGKLTKILKRENSFDPLAVCREMLQSVEYDSITATGYGRHLFASHFKCNVISEIKAFSLGAKAIVPSCKTILDIGGQDIKAISLDDHGEVRKFEMNDKCSAGTGRFLEIMAMILGCDLNEFGKSALSADKVEKINSTCTVFAESEVISLLSRGAIRGNIALGIHHSVVSRARSMLGRIALEDDLVFAGGAAQNLCVSRLLGDSLKRNIIIPDDPQIVGAYGCALFGAKIK